MICQFPMRDPSHPVQSGCQAHSRPSTFPKNQTKVIFCRKQLFSVPVLFKIRISEIEKKKKFPPNF